MEAGAGAYLGGTFQFRCYDPWGNLKWEDTAHNLTVNVGLDHILGVTFKGNAQSTTWYLGLTDSAPTVDAGDTMGSHAGWAEVTAYDEADRQEWVQSTISSQSIDNSGTKASYSINADATTIGGGFMVDDPTKGGTSGTLLCVSAFGGGDKTADAGDTLEVQYTYSAASS